MNNLSKRIFVSIAAIPLIVAVCYLGGIFFLSFALLIGLVSFYEFSVMVKTKSIFVNLWIGLLSVAILILNSYIKFIEAEVLLIIITAVLFFVELFRNANSAVNNLGSTLIGIMYIGIFSSTLIYIREAFNYSDLIYTEGGYLIIALLVSIWVCDSAAYFLGSAYGRHKIFPRVSPNKSWEGAIAGFLFAVLTMLGAKAVILNFLSWKDVVSIGVIVGFFGQAGDFIESLVKRDCGVKDSSALIPGHGGIFDRFDSLLFSSPLIFLYIHFFVK